MPKKNKNNTTSLSFLEGKLKGGKEKQTQNRIQLLFDAWKAEIRYTTLFEKANVNDDLVFQTAGVLQEFVAKKGFVDKEYGLQNVYGKYKPEYKSRYNADRTLKEAKASLENSTEFSAPEAKYGTEFLKKAVDELEEAACKEQIDNEKVAALVIKVDTLRKAVFGKKDTLSSTASSECLMELAQYIEEKKSEEELREKVRREKKDNTFVNRLRRSFKKKSKLPTETKAEKAGSETSATGFDKEAEEKRKKGNALLGKLRHSLKKKAHTPSGASSEAKQLPFDVRAQERAADYGSTQEEQNALGTDANSMRSPAAVGVMEAPLNAWGDASSDYYSENPIERCLSLYEKMQAAQSHSIHARFEREYDAAYEQLSRDQQTEFCRILRSRAGNATSAAPIAQPIASTSSGTFNALQATKDLFTKAYEELNLTKQDALQDQYINAYNQLSGREQDAFDEWAEVFTSKLQGSTDVNRLGESNARYNSWENNSSTFFSSAPAVGSEYRSNAVYVQSEAMKARK